jgi:hypothetical protein
MRKKIFAILILVGFFSLQYGKIVGYLYCKWQAEIVRDLKDCGCDDHLVSMFEHNEDSGANDQQKSMLTEKLNEYMPMQFVGIQQNILIPEKSFTDFTSSLSDSFIASTFHPPAV